MAETRLSAGLVKDLSDTTCTAIGDPSSIKSVVVVRIGEEVCAFHNRCLHQDSPLAGGWVRDGVLSCPLHFWRYRMPDGEQVSGQPGGLQGLESLPVEVVDGEVFITVPDPGPSLSVREQLLSRASAYDRDDAFAAMQTRIADHSLTVDRSEQDPNDPR